MYAHSEIEAENEEVEVVADACSCAEGYLVEEAVQAQLSVGMGIILAHQPHVASIDEESSLESAQYWEAVFGIDLKLEVTRLVEVGVASCIVAVTAWTYAAHGKSTYAVGSAHVKELTIRSIVRVAV